ncbi:DUF2752 domain-containing protein [Actinospica durhamensis]|uniref:DUF2752 domain-containing protein n=1 Tax=Actinospica durhamensis TaxID=1508375 RepID=A0A941INT4_9ACTN|nr:DUF2752 domain-containing protein [Actinospica durhamensis]MBR7834329.1 DUF2752 domain-containing protein [Actinospica durhamensis]
MTPAGPGPALAPRWVRLPPRRPALRVRASAERLAAAALCSLGAAWVHENHDPGALCPLRRLTGIPCPLCGSTTVFMEAGAGHWSAALTANPLTVLATLLFFAVPLLQLDPIQSWAGLPRAWRLGPLALVLALSWVWQLHRFGLL